MLLADVAGVIGVYDVTGSPAGNVMFILMLTPFYSFFYFKLAGHFIQCRRGDGPREYFVPLVVVQKTTHASLDHEATPLRAEYSCPVVRPLTVKHESHDARIVVPFETSALSEPAYKYHLRT